MRDHGSTPIAAVIGVSESQIRNVKQMSNFQQLPPVSSIASDGKSS